MVCVRYHDQTIWCQHQIQRPWNHSLSNIISLYQINDIKISSSSSHFHQRAKVLWAVVKTWKAQYKYSPLSSPFTTLHVQGELRVIGKKYISMINYSIRHHQILKYWWQLNGFAPDLKEDTLNVLCKSTCWSDSSLCLWPNLHNINITYTVYQVLKVTNAAFGVCLHHNYQRLNRRWFSSDHWKTYVTCSCKCLSGRKSVHVKLHRLLPEFIVVTVTFDHQNPISSCLSPCGGLCLIWLKKIPSRQTNSSSSVCLQCVYSH